MNRLCEGSISFFFFKVCFSVRHALSRLMSPFLPDTLGFVLFFYSSERFFCLTAGHNSKRTKNERQWGVGWFILLEHVRKFFSFFGVIFVSARVSAKQLLYKRIWRQERREFLKKKKFFYFYNRNGVFKSNWNRASLSNGPLLLLLREERRCIAGFIHVRIESIAAIVYDNDAKWRGLFSLLEGFFSCAVSRAAAVLHIYLLGIICISGFFLEASCFFCFAAN